MVSLVHILGIAITGASNISTDLVSSNQITDYSFVTQPITLDRFNAALRCASGLGPSGAERNTALGEWFFNGARLRFFTLRNYNGSGLRARGAHDKLYPGVINLDLCGKFTTTEEGVFECRMMNSSMMEQTMRVGVYFGGRSESLDMYPSSHC